MPFFGGDDYIQSSSKFSQIKFFSKREFPFHKGNFFSQTARCSLSHEPWELVPLGELSLAGILQLWNQRFQVSGMQSPMSLGSSASFRRIVPCRDTSTTESEIPSFRDAQPKQSVLAPRHCEERSDVAILSAGKDCFYTSSITPLR